MSETESLLLLNEQNVKIVEQAVQAINNGDADGLLALFADDIKFRMPGTTPVSCRIEGKPAFLEIFGLVAERLDKMITLEVTNVIPAGEWVVTEARGDSLTKKGERYRNTYCHLWKIADGKVAEFTEYNDTQLIMDVLFKD
jgi:ketosteroid isomerase-like protein